MANLVTSEKILPLIQPLLKDVDVESISDSSTISLTKFTTSNRVALRAAVEKTLSNNNITFEDLPKSLGGSFGGTEIYTYDMKKVRFQYKPPQGGGARGGKRIADLGECSQCIYAAISFGLGREITMQDITPANISKYSSKFKIDQTVKEIINELPDVWMTSSILGANKLYSKFFKVNGTFTFHKGSPLVDTINSLFQTFKKNEGLSLNINKWNPADFWLISEDFDINILTS